MPSLNHNFYRYGSATALKDIGLKKEAEISKEDLRKYAPVAAGLGAAALGGPLLYKHLRKFRPSSYEGLRSIQEAARAGGDHLTRVLPLEKPKGKYRQMWDKIRFGADDIAYHTDPARDKLVDIPKAPGVVRNFGPGEEELIQGKFHTGASGATETLEDLIGENKWKEYQFFNKHAPGSMPETQNASTVLKGLGYNKVPKGKQQRLKMLEELKAELNKKYPEGFILKELGGGQSGGIFPTESSDFTDLYQKFRKSGLEPSVDMLFGGEAAAMGVTNATHMNQMIAEFKKDPGYAGRVLNNIVRNPRSAIIQRRVPIEKPGKIRGAIGKALGNPASKEVRVHVEGGRAIPSLATARFDPTMQYLEPGKLRGAAEYAQGIIDRLPPEYRNTGTFAMDIAPLKGGGYTLIEANPGGRSGLLFPEKNPLSGVKLRQALTGRMGKIPSAGLAVAGGVGAGGIAAGATGLGQSVAASNTLDTKKKAPITPPLQAPSA